MVFENVVVVAVAFQKKILLRNTSKKIYFFKKLIFNINTSKRFINIKKTLILSKIKLNFRKLSFGLHSC
jgi:hypothetical protein